jgi:hypothetical protein
MKLDSKYFDMIRISRRRKEDDAPNVVCCQWKGCMAPGAHRAPKGRAHDGEYYLFCEEHVRQYNSSYNYFAGMSEAEVVDFQNDAVTGHRPTWKSGANAWAHGTQQGVSGAAARQSAQARMANARVFYAWRAQQARSDASERVRRQPKPLERKSLEILGLGPDADRTQIKARFKELVKRHHPDSNGGNRASEDRLREIIQAYNFLKQAGLV